MVNISGQLTYVVVSYEILTRSEQNCLEKRALDTHEAKAGSDSQEVKRPVSGRVGGEQPVRRVCRSVKGVRFADWRTVGGSVRCREMHSTLSRGSCRLSKKVMNWNNYQKTRKNNGGFILDERATSRSTRSSKKFVV